MIEAENLSKTFTVHKKEPGFMGSLKSLFIRKKVVKPAVKGASFRIGEGEVVGLVGANGAGKTTLVKMLAGIIYPTGGDARVLGCRPWERKDEFRRQIALIMGQKAQLWWDLPAADCFLLLKEIYRIPEKQFTATLDDLTARLGVKDQLNIQIRRLSLGERMKMELIASLLHRPRVVYLDEPTIGLDLTAQRAIREFILEYQKTYRPAVILTSHYMEDIEQLCRRILILREGEMVYDGPLDAVVRTYAGHKVVTAELQAGAPAIDAAALARLGTVVDAAGGVIRVQVARDAVPAAIGALMRDYPVADLSIEEPEIGTIIEKLMNGKVQGAAG